MGQLLPPKGSEESRNSFWSSDQGAADVSPTAENATVSPLSEAFEGPKSCPYERRDQPAMSQSRSWTKSFPGQRNASTLHKSVLVISIQQTGVLTTKEPGECLPVLLVRTWKPWTCYPRTKRSPRWVIHHQNSQRMSSLKLETSKITEQLFKSS